MAREDPQLKIRFTPELKKEVEEAARGNGRTMNAEVTARLQASFEPTTAARLGELELELAKEHAAAAEARSKAMQYSAALAMIAIRLPPGAFDDTPNVAEILREVSTDIEAKMLAALEEMISDTKKSVDSLQHLVDIGRVNVAPETDK
jgi:hypothetical protein